MAKETIKASEKALGEVFCDKFRFSIPTYQRPYAWTTEEAGELFEDLRRAMGAGDPSEASPYFMGSIVLIKGPVKSEADVVDGQQRLTTLTILICVLRDRLNDLAAHAQSYVGEKGSIFAGTEDRYRLRLRARDACFFETKIQRQGATKSLPLPDTDHNLQHAQIRIAENARLFAQCVDALALDTRQRLLTFMIQRCFLVVVEASDKHSAYRVFSVMNDRGLDLSPTDILKADIIGSIEEESEREIYTDIWEKIEESLGRESFRDLFAHIRMIHRRAKLAETLEAEFHKYVKPCKDAKGFVDKILEPMSEACLWIVNQDFESTKDAERINRSLRHLAMLDNADWQPPTILFLSKFSQEPGRVASFLSALDTLAYGMFILRHNVNKRIGRYADLIRWIDSDDDVLGEDSPVHLSDSEDQAVLQQLDGPIYEIQRVRMPVLLRLDEAVSDGSATYDHRIVSVEHVLPQNPAEDGEWVELFPDKEMRDAWTDRLANLVLLSRAKNSQAQNYAFDRKKAEYFLRKGTSPFALTSQVLNADSWTPNELARRQKALLETCRKIWNLRTLTEHDGQQLQDGNNHAG